MSAGATVSTWPTASTTPILNERTHNWKLQAARVNRPHTGLVIGGNGGLHQVRWALAGRGKRGGVRVIDDWAVELGARPPDTRGACAGALADGSEASPYRVGCHSPSTSAAPKCG
jgi:hypothetical protein